MILLSVIAILTVAAAGAVAYRRKQARRPAPGTTYANNAIRVTDSRGRDMKIIRKEDGTFEMIEETGDRSAG